MAHFAKLNESNIVTQVIVVANEVLLDDNGIEQEQKGIDFLNTTFGNAVWVQTSYNNSIRGQYAEIGGFYDSVKNKFFEPSPFPSWTFNNETEKWVAPVAKPEGTYAWNEENQEWVYFESAPALTE